MKPGNRQKKSRVIDVKAYFSSNLRIELYQNELGYTPNFKIKNL
jgi:hypothetical protein